jgi:hypothetical protein
MTPHACRWLIRHGSSSEAQRREQLGHFIATGRYEFRSRPSPTMAPSASGEPDSIATLLGEMRRDPQSIQQRRGSDLHQWYRSSLAVAKHLAAFGPLYAEDPEIQSCLQAARRNLQDPSTTAPWVGPFAHPRNRGPWQEVAATELWIQQPQGIPPKPVARSVPVAVPPFLDGALEDECWKNARVVKLQDAVARTVPRYATEAWLAHDANYLYLALRCRHPAGGHQVPPVKPRSRDADLRNHDRVSLLLDLDRDYSTYFHFQVDQRGCVHEECWGDRNWNPKWYVAVYSEEDRWQIEAAIPLNELTGDLLPETGAWACNVVRTIPGQGVQAFALPADTVPRPEGMGLLLFTRPQGGERPVVRSEAGVMAAPEPR